MLKTKIVYLKKKSTNFVLTIFWKTHGFYFNQKTLLKIKSCGFRPNNARYEKMLINKIVHLKEIYKRETSMTSHLFSNE